MKMTKVKIKPTAITASTKPTPQAKPKPTLPKPALVLVKTIKGVLYPTDIDRIINNLPNRYRLKQGRVLIDSINSLSKEFADLFTTEEKVEIVKVLLSPFGKEVSLSEVIDFADAATGCSYYEPLHLEAVFDAYKDRIVEASKKRAELEASSKQSVAINRAANLLKRSGYIVKMSKTK